MASPPQPSNMTLNLPRKRPALNTNPSSSKRRKPSSAGPSHLRQTSFPPDGPVSALSPGARTPLSSARSPSVESSLAAGGSLVSSLSRTNRRKRKATDDDNGSGVNGSALNGSGVNGERAGSALGGNEADDAADGDDEDGLVAVNEEYDESAEAQRERNNMLLDRLNPEQTERYDRFRRAKLSNASVRKLINHTLSQSVPPSVVTSVSGMTKIFLGELIEKALGVQREWQAASTTLPTGEKIDDNAPIVERTKRQDCGPLTPDHFREALRRYKKESVGNAAGFLGLSMKGKENTAARVNGRRLFR
ncbi:histone-fold-containing protein [Microthyrium microscopicum]|uniref:Histone-fold-containing protein n=1 Tax=Microthyrium microscopicum TaxID=703497 RepID=A0A6A6UD40_9PEZI|nr:histone-fold-containing protein [Microthyrium microscopicum]